VEVTGGAIILCLHECREHLNGRNTSAVVREYVAELNGLGALVQ
jgi:hypothetical protein